MSEVKIFGWPAAATSNREGVTAKADILILDEAASALDEKQNWDSGVL